MASHGWTYLLLAGDKFPIPISNPGCSHSQGLSGITVPLCHTYFKMQLGHLVPRNSGGSGKSSCIKSQWLHEIFLPGSKEAAVPKAFVKRSMGFCLNALPGVRASQAWRRLCWP